MSRSTYRIIDFSVGLPGSQHDATAWEEICVLREHDSEKTNLNGPFFPPSSFPPCGKLIWIDAHSNPIHVAHHQTPDSEHHLREPDGQDGQAELVSTGVRSYGGSGVGATVQIRFHGTYISLHHLHPRAPTFDSSPTITNDTSTSPPSPTSNARPGPTSVSLSASPHFSITVYIYTPTNDPREVEHAHLTRLHPFASAPSSLSSAPPPPSPPPPPPPPQDHLPSRDEKTGGFLGLATVTTPMPTPTPIHPPPRFSVFNPGVGG
ncbi:hypothetical protein Hypma_011147 [Hypsizygus marmoreus]|uniref:Uncharacterized protein n=1 Tax=Hypsizygus marmoreus TaxID=39966 RepID=A0A369JRS7_HYPMA|nr:hypothetical protein Hypma_011147 [Hypsizygus marmoreus]